jgi:hypothetical protein
MAGLLGCQTASLQCRDACLGHAIALPPALFVPVLAHAFAPALDMVGLSGTMIVV